MKIQNAILGLFLVAATSAQAVTYKCAEKATVALKEGRLQYSVLIKELGKITDPDVVKDHDAASYVRVSILSRDPEEGGKFTLDRPSFKAIATYEDVMFEIDAKKKHGFEFNLYFDEPNDTSMRLRGVKKSIRLNCGSDH